MLSFKTGELEWKSPVENVSLNSLYRHRPGTRQVLENTKTILKVFKTEEIEWMSTPLANAALNGHLEVIKCLVPFEDNLNATKLQFSIDRARLGGHLHVVKYLTSIMNSQ